jgi:hypothetical protein
MGQNHHVEKGDEARHQLLVARWGIDGRRNFENKVIFVICKILQLVFNCLSLNVKSLGCIGQGSLNVIWFQIGVSRYKTQFCKWLEGFNLERTCSKTVWCIGFVGLNVERIMDFERFK